MSNHNTSHNLNQCRAFRSKPIAERLDFLKTNGYYFRCCRHRKHLQKDCKESVSCTVCKGDKHSSALHKYLQKPRVSMKWRTQNQLPCDLHALRFVLKSGKSRSCAKFTLMKVYPSCQPHLNLILYGILYDQCSRTLASSSFVNDFNEN